jgi:hypothetical protein
MKDLLLMLDFLRAHPLAETEYHSDCILVLCSKRNFYSGEVQFRARLVSWYLYINGLLAGWPGLHSQQMKDFFLQSTEFRSALVPTQLIQCILGAPSLALPCQA